MKPPDDRFELRRFEPQDGTQVVRWAQAPGVALAWASLDGPPDDPAIFASWHAEGWVRPYVLLLDQRLAAYGEIWQEPETGEIEIARVIVAPKQRGRGVGRALVERLLATCNSRAPRAAFVRVRPDNTAAVGCYQGAGFRLVSPDQRREYNVDQPSEYLWMTRPVPSQ